MFTYERQDIIQITLKRLPVGGEVPWLKEVVRFSKFEIEFLEF
jgi:hypothetical protein